MYEKVQRGEAGQVHSGKINNNCCTVGRSEATSAPFSYFAVMLAHELEDRYGDLAVAQ